jgi:hypothetical protein
MASFKARVTEFTHRSSEASLKRAEERPGGGALDWQAYVGRVKTPKLWREFDQQTGAIQREQRRRGTTVYPEDTGSRSAGSGTGCPAE